MSSSSSSSRPMVFFGPTDMAITEDTKTQTVSASITIPRVTTQIPQGWTEEQWSSEVRRQYQEWNKQERELASYGIPSDGIPFIPRQPHRVLFMYPRDDPLPHSVRKNLVIKDIDPVALEEEDPFGGIAEMFGEEGMFDRMLDGEYPPPRSNWTPSLPPRLPLPRYDWINRSHAE